MTITTTYTRTHVQGTYLVFDVESCGLYGEGFAVGWVLLTPGGIGEGIAIAPMPEENLWVAENVLPALPSPTHATTREVRDEFWKVWLIWSARGAGALLAADVAFPVETSFLRACHDDDPIGREWDGPYPLVDIASVRLAVGLDPLATVPRLPSELPEHNPLADARQSARLLLEALGREP